MAEIGNVSKTSNPHSNYGPSPQFATRPGVRFLLLDRIVTITCGEAIVGIRAMPRDEDIFAFHFPNNPMFPGSLIIESFAQVGTALLEVSCGFERKALPILIANAKFRRPVGPGADMRIEMRVDSVDGEASIMTGTASQNDARCTTITMGFTTAPLRDFYPPSYDGVYRSTYENWLRGTEFAGFDGNPMERLPGG